MITTDKPLHGKRVLLVEDEYLLAEEMAREFEGWGAEVIGPMATVQEAMTVLEQGTPIDAAVLDIKLRGELAFGVADRLMERSVPFVFATGYGQEVIPPKFDRIPRREKPIAQGALPTVLLEDPKSNRDAARSATSRAGQGDADPAL